MCDVILDEKGRVLRHRAAAEEELVWQDDGKVVLVVEPHQTPKVIGLTTHYHNIIKREPIEGVKELKEVVESLVIEQFFRRNVSASAGFVMAVSRLCPFRAHLSRLSRRLEVILIFS